MLKIYFQADNNTKNSEQSISEYDEDASKDYVDVKTNDPYVLFAAKVALEEYKDHVAKHSSLAVLLRHLQVEKVDKAERWIGNGCHYKISFTALVETKVYPTYNCDALVYKNTKDVFYVKKVNCIRNYILL